MSPELREFYEVYQMWLDGEDIPFSVNTGLRGNLEIAASGNKALHDSILDEMQLSFIKAGLHVGHPFNKNHLMRNLEFQQGTVRENTARNTWVRNRLQQPA